MILILSKSSYESTTEEVMDWLGRLGAHFVRVNDDDFDSAEVLVTYSQGAWEIRLKGLYGLDLNICDDTERTPVRVVWFRRWYAQERDGGSAGIIDSGFCSREDLQHSVKNHLTLEFRRLSQLFFSQLSGFHWLSCPDEGIYSNKLLVLKRAVESGLATPATLVTSQREGLRRFAASVGPVITKPISEAQIFHADGRFYFMYTASLDMHQIDALPEHFPASLFQERVPKEYEVRVFFLDGECYAMAIFSQSDPQTSEDFRYYNQARPNRYVPYLLSRVTADAIAALMHSLELETGSVDLIHTPDGRDVFLEVNPVGQFGMISKACNYPLERRVAELLVRKNRDGRA